MTNETGGISAKELLVFVPAAGSAMALSWEAGSFLPIGGGSFMLFTLTEHLLFAVQALPAMLVIVSAFFLPLALGWRLDRVIESASKKIIESALKKIKRPAVPSDADPVAELARRLKIQRSRLRRGMTTMWLISIAFGLLISYWGFHVRLAAIIVFGLGLAGAAMLRETSPTKWQLPLPTKLRQLPLFCWLLIASLGVAMALGSDYSRRVLNNDRNIVDVKVRQVTKKAVLVRSGERGVLLFEPQTGRFSVEKWDVVEGLDWERAPLVKMLFKDSQTPGVRRVR